MPQARDLVKDLYVHKPWVYWTDFLISMAIGYTAALTYMQAPLFSVLQIVTFFIAGFALFRVASFVHEIVHFRKGEMVPFTVGWNLLAGIIMLTPSHFYANHVDHHNAKHYGTGQDGEYLPLGRGPLLDIFFYLVQPLYLPLLALIRFLVFTPLSFLSPKLRDWVLRNGSSLILNLRYRRRPIPSRAPRTAWAWLEIGCFLRAAAIFGFVAVGLAPFLRWPLLYALAMLILFLNSLRNLVAHRYHSEGESMSHDDQFFDSVNIEGGRFLGGPITELFFPLNLRYHAVHHLFPTLPYHNLRIAHRRLMEHLPADSPYRKTVYPSFWSALAALLQDTRRAAKENFEGAKRWYRRRREILAASQ